MTLEEFDTTAQNKAISDSQLIALFHEVPVTGIDRWLPPEKQQAPLVLDILARHRPLLYSAFIRIGMEGV